MAMGRQLEGMVAIITGASSGIGAALAMELGRHGAHLALAARRLDRLQEIDRALGGGHWCVECDVGDPSQCHRLVEQTAQRLGRIDTLICNAGYGIFERAHRTTLGDVRRMFDVNLLGTTECIRLAVPIMQRQDLRDGWRGQIVIVSSAAARRGIPYLGFYSATKAAQLSIAESLRVELRGDRIAVTSVPPIGTQTEFGQVARQLSANDLSERSRFDIVQTSRRVARRIVDSIRRPRPEVWPFPPSRLALSAATALPGLTDWIMAGQRKLVEGPPAP
jgi:short-subunit dehydrogenase